MTSTTIVSDFPKNRRNRRGAVSGETCREEDFTKTERKLVPKDAATRKALEHAIKGNVLMSHLDTDDLNDVFDAMFHVKNKKAKDVIIQQGEEGDNFYIVDKGAVEVLVNGERVGTIKEGGSFGELALIYGTPRAATIRVISDNASFWGIDRFTYRRILMGNTIRKRKLYCDFLRKVPVLSGLDEWQLLTVADALEQVEFEANSTVVKEGDDGDEFFIIIEGEANVSRHDHGIVNLLRTSDYFGEVALIWGGPRRATVISRTKLRCVKIDRERFERVMGPCKDLLSKGIEAYGID